MKLKIKHIMKLKLFSTEKIYKRFIVKTIMKGKSDEIMLQGITSDFPSVSSICVFNGMYIKSAKEAYETIKDIKDRYFVLLKIKLKTFP